MKDKMQALDELTELHVTLWTLLSEEGLACMLGLWE